MWAQLLDKLDSGEIELVTNSIIIKEWDRNKVAKETYIDKWENRIKANLNYFKSIEKYFDREYRKMLFEIHEKFEKIIREKIAKSKFHIDQVEEQVPKCSNVFYLR